jgi:3-methyladenine DNA glycosylase AlkD
MVYKSKKKLKKLSNKEIAEDIKKYIKSSHTFYETKVPEIKILAKKLHDEYNLNEFYKVFNRFWKSGYHSERTLAISTLQLYKEEFNLDTWRFLKTKLKEIKSWDKADIVSLSIIGEILLKNPELKEEIVKMANSKNAWVKRMALMSLIPLIRNDNVDFAMEIVKINLNDKLKPLQEATGLVLKEIGDKKPSIAKKFILKNIHMPLISFNTATENMKDLRKLRDIKKLNKNGVNKLFFWKNI